MIENSILGKKGGVGDGVPQTTITKQYVKPFVNCSARHLLCVRESYCTISMSYRKVCKKSISRLGNENELSTRIEAFLFN